MPCPTADVQHVCLCGNVCHRQRAQRDGDASRGFSWQILVDCKKQLAMAWLGEIEQDYSRADPGVVLEYASMPWARKRLFSSRIFAAASS